jgi:hypothetical protein
MCEYDYKLCSARLSLVLELVKELFEATGVLPIDEELSSLFIHLTADHQSLLPREVMRVCDTAFGAIRTQIEENPELAAAVEKRVVKSSRNR